MARQAVQTVLLEQLLQLAGHELTQEVPDKVYPERHAEQLEGELVQLEQPVAQRVL